MHDTPWIERLKGRLQTPPEEESLRQAYLGAQKLAFELVCICNELVTLHPPDVTECASLVREALNRPERERDTAIQIAGTTVRIRQVHYYSTITRFKQIRDTWNSIRLDLVEKLEAVAAPNQNPHALPSHRQVDVEVTLNCQAVAALIDQCDRMLEAASQRRRDERSHVLAKTSWQNVFETLAAEVAGEHWLGTARLACHAAFQAEVLRKVPVDRVTLTRVPEDYVSCRNVDAAREAFEKTFDSNATTNCRTFHRYKSDLFNDALLSERLLSAVPDTVAMQRIEEERDSKLGTYWRKWHTVREQVENCQEMFVKVAELLPAAVAEAQSIQNVRIRRQAQNLCMFSARRLKENQALIKAFDRQVGERHAQPDIADMASRSHYALLERIRTKSLRCPTYRRRES